METTYYKGCRDCKSEDNVIVDNYIKGYYFNKVTDMEEAIPEGVNKYNKQFLADLMYLNSQFYGLVLTFSVVSELIKRHDIVCSSDIKDLWRLAHAQSSTIKFNLSFRASLRRYQVAKIEIYKSIVKAIEIQKNRAERNKKMVERILADYNMDIILEAVKEDTGLDLFEHCAKFRDDALKDIITLTDEDKKKESERIKEEYIEYLEKLAERKGISLYDSVSDSVVHRIEVNKAIRERINAEDKEYRVKKLRSKQITSLHNDNILIQSDINSLADIVDGRIVGKKFQKILAKKMIERLQGVAGSIYYIGLVKETYVRYLGKDGAVGSIVHARLFKTLQSAQKCLDSAKADLDGIGKELNGYCAKIMKLIVLKPKELSIEEAELKFDKTRELRDTLKHPYSISDKIICKRVVEGALGILTTSSQGEAYVYVYIGPERRVGILCTRFTGEIYLGYTDFKPYIVSKPVKDEYNRDIPVKVDNGQVVCECVKLQFNCEFYQNKLEVLYSINQTMHTILHGDIESNCRIRGISKIKPFEKLRKRIDELLKYSVEVYYILGVSVHSNQEVRYCKLSNTTRCTNGVSAMDLFTSYDEAFNSCKILNEGSFDARRFIWRIFQIGKQ